MVVRIANFPATPQVGDFSFKHYLEGEVLGGFLFQFFLLRFFSCFVYQVSIHIDGFIWPGRAGVFTPPTSHADGFIHFRNHKISPGGIDIGYHGHRLGRAVLGAGPAIGVVRIDHTVLLDELGYAHLGLLFLRNRQGHDGSAWTA